MAESNDTIDPNDLDSIDALLDEAELDAVEEDAQPETAELPDIPEDEQLDNLPEEDAPEPEPELELPQPSGGIMDNFPSPDAEDTPQKAAEPELEPLLDDAEAQKPKPPKETPAAPLTEDGAEQFMQKRAAKKAQLNQDPQNKNTLTVAEMDAIKKLIITFSSIIIALVVVAIATGVWAALATSPALDEEAKTLLGDIRDGSTQSMIKSASSEEIVKKVETKLDALSFQIEELNRDLLQMTPDQLAAAPAKPAAPADKAEVKLDLKPTETAVKAQATPPVSPATMQVTGMDPELVKKMDTVNSRMLSTQRRVNEINNRVKSLQSEYKSILRTVMKVEKELLAEKVKVDAETKKELAQQEADRQRQEQRARERARAYEYSAPTSPYFDSY